MADVDRLVVPTLTLAAEVERRLRSGDINLMSQVLAPTAEDTAVLSLKQPSEAEHSLSDDAFAGRIWSNGLTIRHAVMSAAPCVPAMRMS